MNFEISPEHEIFTINNRDIRECENPGERKYENARMRTPRTTLFAAVDRSTP